MPRVPPFVDGREGVSDRACFPRLPAWMISGRVRSIVLWLSIRIAGKGSARR